MERPILSAGLLYFEKAGKHLFFVPDIPNWLVVNQNGAILLFRCKGNSSSREILDSLALSGRTRQEAEALMREARFRGVLTDSIESEQKKPSLDSQNSSKEIINLRSLYIKLTNRCNLKCKYCYANSGISTVELDMETLKRILKEAGSVSKKLEIVLSGGEPLLNKNTLDFAEEIVSAGHDAQLLTNGTLISSSDIAKRISKTFKLIKISIDGSTDSIHSLSRGPENFDKVTNGINLLIENGGNVQAAMTVTKLNIHNLAEMSDKYRSRLTLQPMFKAGRGKSETDISITGEEYYNAMNAVDNIAPMGNVAAVLEGLRGRGVKRCALAEREISIAEDGNVYPCQLLHLPEYLSGNIYNSSVEEIYNNSPVLSGLRKLNVDTIEGCSTCAIRLICAGGCRARSYYESGRLDVSGEFCQYEKLAFINGLLDYSNFTL